jgi:hypothetical protein
VLAISIVKTMYKLNICGHLNIKLKLLMSALNKEVIILTASQLTSFAIYCPITTDDDDDDCSWTLIFFLIIG